MNNFPKYPALLLLLILIISACGEKTTKEEVKEETVEEVMQYTAEEQAVIDGIQRLYTGMATKDGDLAASAWYDLPASFNANIDSTGAVKLRLEDLVGDMEGMREWLNTTTEDLSEPIHDVVVHIDGPLAAAWVPYKFYRNGKFSHEGTNAFTLLQIEGDWKIVTVVDTRYWGGRKAS